METKRNLIKHRQKNKTNKPKKNTKQLNKNLNKHHKQNLHPPPPKKKKHLTSTRTQTKPTNHDTNNPPQKNEQKQKPKETATPPKKKKNNNQTTPEINGRPPHLASDQASHFAPHVDHGGLCAGLRFSCKKREIPLRTSGFLWLFLWFITRVLPCFARVF